MAQTCQYCGTTTDNDARVMCPNCGRRIRGAGEGAPPTPAAAPAEPPASEGLPAAPPLPSAGTPYGQPPYASGQPPYAGQGPYGGGGGGGGQPPYGQAPYQEPAYGQPMATEPPRPQLYVSRAAQRETNRATVAFRLILAIPHLLAVGVVGVAAAVVVIIAWFAALFTARVPGSLYDFLGWYTTYAARVYAYLFFLTDRWPIFDRYGDYPLQVWLEGPARLNRLAVLFRLVLLVPVYFMAQFTAIGLVVISPVVWLITLILGRMPRAVFNASASVVRYQTRYYAYGLLLTAAWPLGLFGDPQDRREDDLLPGDDAPADAPRPPVLHRSAQSLLVVILLLGIAGYIAEWSTRSHSTNNSNAVQQFTR